MGHIHLSKSLKKSKLGTTPRGIRPGQVQAHLPHPLPSPLLWRRPLDQSKESQGPEFGQHGGDTPPNNPGNTPGSASKSFCCA